MGVTSGHVPSALRVRIRLRAVHSRACSMLPSAGTMTKKSWLLLLLLWPQGPPQSAISPLASDATSRLEFRPKPGHAVDAPNRTTIGTAEDAQLRIRSMTSIVELLETSAATGKSSTVRGLGCAS